MSKLQEKNQAIEMRQNGLSLKKIANELKVSKGSVSVWVRNVSLTEEQRRILIPKCTYSTPVNEQSVAEAKRLTNEGKSQDDIAKYFGWPSGSVHMILLKNGIRTHGKKTQHYDNCQICSNRTRDGRRLCHTCWSKVARTVNKVRAIRLLGGHCVRCGWEPRFEEYAGLDFHHTDSSNKDHNMGNIFNGSWKRVEEELSKCQLLCSRCHSVFHSERNGNISIRLEAERWMNEAEISDAPICQMGNL